MHVGGIQRQFALDGSIQGKLPLPAVVVASFPYVFV